MSQSQLEDLARIVIHYKDKSKPPRVIKDGLALYTTNNDQDACMEFVGIDSISKLKSLLAAVGHALEFAEQQWSEMEAIEKEVEGHKDR